MKAEFGDVAVHEVHKGENVGWFLDQRLVSILVSDWAQQHGPGRVKLVRRNTRRDRSVALGCRLFYAISILYRHDLQLTPLSDCRCFMFEHRPIVFVCNHRLLINTGAVYAYIYYKNVTFRGCFCVFIFLTL